MANQQTLQGNWNEITGKLRSKWGQLTQDELTQYQGNASQLVGYIQRKTGEARGEIEKFVNDLMSKGGEGAGHALESAREYANQASESMREGYRSAEQMVQQRPGQAVAMAFGAGLLTGVILTLMMRD